MESKIRKEMSIVLVLNKKEALWLKEYVQNKLLTNETDKDREMRMVFWRALPELDEL